MKPILFNTEMVRAILDGRKTVTRQVVKPQPAITPNGSIGLQDGIDFLWLYTRGEKDEYTKAPFQPGDILYVRETFQQNYDGSFSYRAGHKFEKEGGWRPSIHMPREAARIFLRVTDVRVERLQDIQERGPASATAEGFVNDIDMLNGTGKSAAKHFSEAWNRTVKPEKRAIYGWDANPFVWVIEFDRISREEAEG